MGKLCLTSRYVLVGVRNVLISASKTTFRITWNMIGKRVYIVSFERVKIVGAKGPRIKAKLTIFDERNG